MSLSTPKSVTLVADGDKDKITTTAATVSEFLTDEKVKVGDLDKLSQVPSTPLRDGLTVKIARVTQKKVTKTSAIDHKTKKTSTSKLYKGESKVVTAGKDGVQKAVWQITRTDGKITKRKLVDTSVTRKPVTEVVQVGTKAKPAESSSSSGGSSSGGSSSGGSVGGGVDSLNWAALAECESGGNPKAVNPAGYYGLYQFSTSTWAAMGGSGNPADASSSEQTYRAKLLYKQSGAGQWPVCGKNL
nr:resuscitation-promoting factor [Kineosporia mesophila]